MSRLSTVLALSVSLLLGGLSRPAHAQWAVVDVGAIAQLVRQVATLQQQLQNAEQQLGQAREQYSSMTGGRGMQNLLGGLNRNYLPPNWGELGSALAVPIRATVNANAVLGPTEVAALSPAERQHLGAARGNAALLAVAAQEAYGTTSRRFDSLQQLISAIPSATDPKGILDLQARIQAEQGMLANESTKLAVLYQAAQAKEWARQQSAREQVVAGIGNLRNLPPLRLP